MWYLCKYIRKDLQEDLNIKDLLQFVTTDTEHKCLFILNLMGWLTYKVCKMSSFHHPSLCFSGNMTSRSIFHRLTTCIHLRVCERRQEIRVRAPQESPRRSCLPPADSCHLRWGGRRRPEAKVASTRAPRATAAETKTKGPVVILFLFIITWEEAAAVDVLGFPRQRGGDNNRGQPACLHTKRSFKGRKKNRIYCLALS